MALKKVRWTELSLRFLYKPVVSFMGLFPVSEPHLRLKAKSVLRAVSGQLSQCVWVCIHYRAIDILRVLVFVFLAEHVMYGTQPEGYDYGTWSGNDVVHIVICHSDIFVENIDIFPVFSINIEQRLITAVPCRASFVKKSGWINFI